MDFINLHYQGRKDIADPYNSAERWTVGDTRLVPEEHARKLLAHPEFSRAKAAEKSANATKAKDDDTKLQEALSKKQVKDDQEKDEAAQLEQMLITVDSMDKPALLEYAAKYPEPVNSRLGEANLRIAVRNLVETFGVR